MISERKFSNSYSSFWNQLLPTADSFVRHLNLSSNRFNLPVLSSGQVDRDRRAVINELAFRLFKEKSISGKVASGKFSSIEENVRAYIQRLAQSINPIDPLSNKELSEAKKIANSLSRYFYGADFSNIVFWPLFKGCGQLDSCKADIIYLDRLVEVKAGDRHFKTNDLRQIITYLALNFYSMQYQIENIALVNPRTGLKFECTVDELIESCSGTKAVDVFSDVIAFVSTEVGSM
ncbi:hypothetical protein [Geomonas azotofigens]|uniref:hypothetical protein n=1 Tax=Geomonas azotofigens TaxID=2843196 RepID=UPI001C115F98|nr:hypothetical protein [Geomonas azotofigens]MBU5613224.1 hypothetical protein [Geomonas azotofigens]